MEEKTPEPLVKNIGKKTWFFKYHVNYVIF